jgi:hypothetical protein
VRRDPEWPDRGAPSPSADLDDPYQPLISPPATANAARIAQPHLSFHTTAPRAWFGRQRRGIQGLTYIRVRRDPEWPGRGAPSPSADLDDPYQPLRSPLATANAAHLAQPHLPSHNSTRGGRWAAKAWNPMAHWLMGAARLSMAGSRGRIAISWRGRTLPITRATGSHRQCRT